MEPRTTLCGEHRAGVRLQAHGMIVYPEGKLSCPWKLQKRTICTRKNFSGFSRPLVRFHGRLMSSPVGSSCLESGQARVRDSDGLRPSRRSRFLSRAQEPRSPGGSHRGCAAEAGTLVKRWAPSDNPAPERLAGELPVLRVARRSRRRADHGGGFSLASH